MAQDNTPLLAAVSASCVQARARASYAKKFTDDLLGEAEWKMAPVPGYLVSDPSILPIDCAIFFTPLTPNGLKVLAPSCKEAIDRFLYAELPKLDPDMSKFSEIPADRYVNKLLSDRSLVVIFGLKGTINQVMDVKEKFKFDIHDVTGTFKSVQELLVKIQTYLKPNPDYVTKEEYFSKHSGDPMVTYDNILDRPGHKAEIRK